MPNSGNKPTITSLTDIATAFTAYVAIPAVLFYPVGFLSRWLQIYRPYDIKIQTAWHATAVSDKLDVIGQGVLVLIPPLALSILLSILLGNVVYYFFSRPKQHELASPYRSQEQEWRAAFIRGLMVLALFVLLASFKIYSCALLIGAVPQSFSQLWICARSDWPITLAPMLGYFLGCLVGGCLISRDFRRAMDAKMARQEDSRRREAEEALPEPRSPSSPGVLKRAWHAFRRTRETYPLAFITGLRERWFLWGLAVAYVVSIASVLLLSPFQEEPSLPRVSYDDPEDFSREVGLLLSHHADGRWYILHSDVTANPETFEAEGQWDTELLAIPDDVAGDVRFLRADPETVYAHKGESVKSRGIPTYYPGDTIRIALDMRDDESGVLSASVGLFQNSEDCHREESEPDIEKFRSFRGEVEKGENTKMLKIEVTNEKVTNKDIPLGKYSCQRIKVTDAASPSNPWTFYRDISVRVEKDKKPPELQDVQITK
jgi:hypothetical protein